MSLPFVGASRQQLATLRDRLSAWTPTQSAQDDIMLADREIHPQVRMYLLGLLNAQLGHYTDALQAADVLPTLAGTAVARDLAADFAHAVRAEVLRMRGQPLQALNELQRARMHFDANRIGNAPFYAQTRERYVRAELLNELRRPVEALGWYGSLDEHGPWGRALLAHAALQQAHIHDEVRRSTEAIRHYARFVDLWQDAEPRFRPAVEQAKQRLASLRRAN
jgi:tetratricopeptide (TPR) repeat protein